ncbi:NTF2-related export protein 2 isoform X2 [Apus apus]|nr:NTF2-related export protein 2 isoform X2 [Apus apus]XP_051486319.1 NTF2-related export protein 2 isoform X2 [Apus apus]XP_051486320.1 NTF2-related export protein 2 isoform X2 [Apus apus]XP_051486321.1 NTF2-related export protein 2 isoform X2 [Apus apus]XP_051486322.1 NTF2-related export protein 2 isoform X2 [Apus apus]
MKPGAWSGTVARRHQLTKLLFSIPEVKFSNTISPLPAGKSKSVEIHDALIAGRGVGQTSLLRCHLSDFKTYVDQACRAADEFVNIYYETMDKRRRALTRLYLDKATLVWNGNAVSGQEELNKFFEMLPSTEFQVHVLDCQPVHEQATQGQTTVLVVTSGTVKFDGDKQRYFNQNFLLTAQATPTNTVWKIASDCFRFQDWAS